MKNGDSRPTVLSLGALLGCLLSCCSFYFVSWSRVVDSSSCCLIYMCVSFRKKEKKPMKGKVEKSKLHIFVKRATHT